MADGRWLTVVAALCAGRSTPILPAIKSNDLQCLSDPVYFDLARRDRMLRNDSAELRALLNQYGAD